MEVIFNFGQNYLCIIIKTNYFIDVLEDDALGNSNRVSFVTYILLGLAMCFLVCVVSGTVYFFGKWRHKPGSGDIPTHEPLLENSQNCSITGYVGSNPIQLKEIRAHGKFGSVWRVCNTHLYIQLMNNNVVYFN